MERSLAEALVTAITSALKPTDEKTFMGDPVFKMDIAKDRFIHFTTPDRAREIVELGKLLMNPPYKKFGADHVAAVSLVWGVYVPGVQTTHIKGKDIVGVIFKTRKKPDSGHPEEVVWHTDVPLKDAKIVSGREGLRLLKKAKPPVEDEDDFEVQY